MPRRRVTQDPGRQSKTPFRYPGSKGSPKVRRWVLSFVPPDTREYREPFVGGGGVFFAVNNVGNRWINDAHGGLIATYLALRDRPEQFLAACRAIAPGDEDRLRATFDRLADDAAADAALRYFFHNRTAFAGRVKDGRLHFSNPSGWDLAHSNVMECAARRLRGVRVTHGDFSPLLSEPGDGVLVYCDPPYLRDTELPESGKLYQHTFARADHERLAESVRRSPHRVCLSYDDDPLVRSLYRGMTLVENAWQYRGVSNGSGRVGGELLVLNYDPPTPFLFAG